MTYDPEYHSKYYQDNKKRKRAQADEWARQNPDKVRESRARQSARRRELGLSATYRREWESRNRDYVLWNAARQRAKKHGIEFTISKEDIYIPEFCPILGIKINVTERGRMRPDAPSLDKFDPAKGYIPGNVWVISWRANRMKCDASPSELRSFCEGMLAFLNSANCAKGVGEALG